MNFKKLSVTTAAAAAAALVAACGGGGGGGAAATPGSTVVLNGTAATGLAIASAPVQVRCASGTGSATTDASGAYTVTVTNGSFPCMVEVASVIGGQTVTLHSIAEGGTANGTTSTARINVTPLTELIVATVLNSNPAAAFQSFGSQAVSPQQLASATTTVLTAVKNALGVDLGSIDPFKSDLVAATASAPTAGNTYDKALDALAAKFGPRSLPLLVAQLVASGGTTASSLAGALVTGPGCPSAVSGPYRAIAMTGETAITTLDFKAMTASFAGLQGKVAIQPNPSQACDFSLDVAELGPTASYEFAISPQGAGAFSMRQGAARLQGYMVPVQTTSLADAVGTWTLAQTGLAEETNPRVNWLSKFTVDANGFAEVCDYDAANNWTGSCTPDTSFTRKLSVLDDGSLELREGKQVVGQLWAFRAANGTTTLFGTTNPTGTSATKTSLVLTKQQDVALPSVGTVTKGLNFRTIEGAPLAGQAPYVTNYTVKSVDTGSNSYVRGGTSAGVVVNDQTVTVNSPQVGLRYLVLQTPQIQLPVTGAGLTLTVASGVYNNIISVLLP